MNIWVTDRSIDGYIAASRTYIINIGLVWVGAEVPVNLR